MFDGAEVLKRKHRLRYEERREFLSRATPERNYRELSYVEPDLNWKIMAAADMDQDGKTDLVWQHLTTGYLRIWHMSGQQKRDSMDVLLNGSPHTVGANSQWRLAGVADFNGDLWPDFVWRNYAPNDGGLAAWYMTDRAISATVWLYPPANLNLDWKLVGVADIAQNGVRDGKPDLIWQNPVSGYLGLRYMDGVQTVLTIISRRTRSAPARTGDW